MANKTDKQFVYVTYIKTTPEKLWDALTNPKVTKLYWFNIAVTSDWKVGSPVTYVRDGVVKMAGEVLIADYPKTLSYTFHEEVTEASVEPPTKVVLSLDMDQRGFVKLTVVHSDFVQDSKHLPSISGGWPAVLSGLKTLLETNSSLGF